MNHQQPAGDAGLENETVPISTHLTLLKEKHLLEEHFHKKEKKQLLIGLIIALAVTIIAILSQAFTAQVIMKNAPGVPYLVNWGVRDGELEQSITRIDPGTRTYQQSQDYVSLKTYLECHEGYSYIFFERQAKTCTAMTARESRDALREVFESDAKKYPNNLYARYGEKGNAMVKVSRPEYYKRESDGDIVFVRYSVREVNEQGVEKIVRWNAQIKYSYDRSKVRAEEYDLNPLGFQVSVFERKEVTVVENAK